MPIAFLENAINETVYLAFGMFLIVLSSFIIRSAALVSRWKVKLELFPSYITLLEPRSETIPISKFARIIYIKQSPSVTVVVSGSLLPRDFTLLRLTEDEVEFIRNSFESIYEVREHQMSSPSK